MKKLLIALLATCMVTSTLVGCGGGGDTTSKGNTGGDASVTEGTESKVDEVNSDGTVNNPENVKVDKDKLVFWSLFSGGDGEFMDKIVTEYNASNPPKQVQSVMLVWADYYTKLTTAVAANKGPDIGVSHISKLPELVEQGIVQPITEETKAVGTDWAEYNDSMKEGVSFDGDYYAMPLDTHAELIYTNRAILEQAGVPMNEKGQMTVVGEEAFKAELDKIKAVIPEGSSTIGMTANGDDPYRVWWATYFQMGGAPLFDEAGKNVTMDKDIAVKAADFVNSLYTEGYIMPGIADPGKLFQGGQAGLLFGGTWSTGFLEQTKELNFAGQAFPKWFENDSCWADAHTLIIPTKKSRSAEDTEKSVAFINYAASTGALTWAGSGQIPSNIKVQESEEYKALPYRSDYKDAAATAILPSKNSSFYSMKDAMIKSLDTIWGGTADSKAAIDDMYDQLKSNLG